MHEQSQYLGCASALPRMHKILWMMMMAHCFPLVERSLVQLNRHEALNAYIIIPFISLVWGNVHFSCPTASGVYPTMHVK